MSDSQKIKSAATAAASFNLMLMQIFYSPQGGPVADDLRHGLDMNGTQHEAWDMIQELSNQGTNLTATPARLAQENPETCIALGELFAAALLAGAGSNESHYRNNAVDFNHKNRAISDILADMNAKTLSDLFRPNYN